MDLSFTPRVVALVVAFALFVWAAAVVADWVSYGTPAFLTNIGLAAFVVAFAPWHSGQAT